MLPKLSKTISVPLVVVEEVLITIVFDVKAVESFLFPIIANTPTLISLILICGTLFLSIIIVALFGEGVFAAVTTGFHRPPILFVYFAVVNAVLNNRCGILLLSTANAIVSAVFAALLISSLTPKVSVEVLYTT